jgi:hypothetical protein
MTPYEVIKVLKKVGFRDERDLRKNHDRYSFPSYRHKVGDHYYQFEVSLSGGWTLTANGSNVRSRYFKMSEIPDFITSEFGAEYLRDHNIEKILK